MPRFPALFARPAGGLASDTSVFWALTVCALVLGLCAWHSGLVFVHTSATLCAIALLLGASMLCGVVRYGRALADAGYYVASWYSFGLVGAVASYQSARWGFPLQDDTLSAVDAALGFDWLDWSAWVSAHPTVDWFLRACYDSITWQPLVFVAYFSLTANVARNRELLQIALLSVLVTCLIAGVLPARGTFARFGIDSDYGAYVAVLDQLRGGTVTQFSLSALKGIVSFPSYHTVMAIMFAYVWRDQKWVLPFAVFGNGCMLLAIPVCGGHYVADMLGGAVVAIASIWAVRRLPARRREAAVSAELSPGIIRLKTE